MNFNRNNVPKIKNNNEDLNFNYNGIAKQYLNASNKNDLNNNYASSAKNQDLYNQLNNSNNDSKINILGNDKGYVIENKLSNHLNILPDIQFKKKKSILTNKKLELNNKLIRNKEDNFIGDFKSDNNLNLNENENDENEDVIIYNFYENNINNKEYKNLCVRKDVHKFNSITNNKEFAINSCDNIPRVNSLLYGRSL